MGEALARDEALADLPGEPAWCFGPFRLLPRQRLLLRDGLPLRPGSRALEILMVLVGRAGEVVPKDELIARVWRDSVVDEGSLRVHVAALRKLLGDQAGAAGGSGPHYIQNVPMRGYSFVAPVRRVTVDGVSPPADSPPPAPTETPATPAHNLPATLTRLVGREAALSQLLTQLHSRRFVTLIGPAGIGKTALALAAADAMRGACSDGVFFVDLAPASDPRLVPSALATVLGIPLISSDPSKELVSGLRHRRLLVVLDNCEHLIDAAALLAESLVAAVPGLRLMATSREPLRAMGECVQRLGGLPLEGLDATATAQQALACPVVQLLVERAAAASDDFQFTDADVPAALQLCRRLDGIPLAIELVATRTAMFGLRGLADRLDDHLALSTQGRRTALPRHKTLHAALDWSHALLGDGERSVLRRLSVFRDRFSLVSACAICRDDRLGPTEVRDAVAGLVAKSLLATEVGDGVLYRMLETTRRYAAGKLALSGEAADMQRRHAQHVGDWLEAAERDLPQLSASSWRDVHARRLDDLRAALDWASGDPGDDTVAAALTAAASPLWFHLGLVRECLERVEHATTLQPRLPPDDLRDMRLALALGHAHLHTSGAGAGSEAALSRSLAIATRLGRAHDQLRALWGLFTERVMRGDYAAAHTLGGQFGQVAEGLDDRQATLTLHRMQALSLHMLAQHEAARRHAELALQPPAIDIRFLHGSAYQVDHHASALTPLARILWIQGHAQRAASLAHEAVDRASRVEHGFSLTYALALAAIPIALWMNDLPRARTFIDQLRDCTARHSLEFWQTWCRMYERVLEPRPQGGAEPDWLAEAARHPGRADMLATLGHDLLAPLARQRADAGHNPWCAAEIGRAATELAWHGGRCDAADAETGFRRALALAREQQALAWELRSATSLVRVVRQAGAGAAVDDVLADVIDRFPADSGSPELAEAKRLLAD